MDKKEPQREKEHYKKTDIKTERPRNRQKEKERKIYRETEQEKEGGGLNVQIIHCVHLMCQ